MNYSLCWLTDGDELFNSAFLTEEELEEERRNTEIHTVDNYWWIKSDKEPDLPRSQFFSHVDRKDNLELKSI